MTAYPAWTPASRQGIIPLHPLSFGTILGRSFSALRQNPKVLLGFALVVQTAVYLVLIVGIAGIAFASFIRLDTLRPGSEDYETVLAGSVLITALAGFVLGLAATALSVIVQAVVVAEVAHSVLAERLTLRALWQRVKPVAWRLIGYTFLLTLGLLVLFAVDRRRDLRARLLGARRRDRPDDPGGARQHPARAVALHEAGAGPVRPGPGARDDPRRCGAIVDAHPRPVLAGPRRARRHRRHHERARPGGERAVLDPVDRRQHDHRAHRRPDPRRDRRHRHRHRAHPGGRAAHPVHRDRRAGHGRLADLHRLPDAPRGTGSRSAVLHRTTGCRGTSLPDPSRSTRGALSRARRGARLRYGPQGYPGQGYAPQGYPSQAVAPQGYPAQYRAAPPLPARPEAPPGPADSDAPLPPYATPPATAWTAPGAASGDDTA